MSADVKLYTSEDLRSRAVTDVVLPSRLRATVEALERVTKERDEARGRYYDAKNELDAALAACAEMRGELQAWACEAPPCAFRCPASALCERTQHALSSDAGRGWVSPEEHEKVVDAFESNSKEASEVFEVLLARGLIPNVKPGPRLAEIVSTMVSPEAFDAALREVARELCPYPASCANCDAIIAAAKAKHGGGR